MRACGGLWPPGSLVAAAAVVLLLGGVGPARGSEDIVVGCGGFVKSDVEINYSLIEVSARPAAGARARCVTLSQSLDLSGLRWPRLRHQAVAPAPRSRNPCLLEDSALRGLSTIPYPPRRTGLGVPIVGSASEWGWGPRGMCAKGV